MKTSVLKSNPLNPELERFAEHVRKGFKLPQKQISSEYFYDTAGARIFQEIMAMPEYYLTRTEEAILREHKTAIAELIAGNGLATELIEFGSGDGSKIIPLCVAAAAHTPHFTFRPMDVSGYALQQLQKKMSGLAPHIRVSPTIGNYFAALPPRRPNTTLSAMFLGGNLGNFSDIKAVALLRHFHQYLRKGEVFFLGVDLKKDPATILNAYNDDAGITARFNLNLLTRMNRELGFDFASEQFEHYASYSPLDGCARSFLVSKKAQKIYSTVLRESFSFDSGETIFTEESKKYSLNDIKTLADKAGFIPHSLFTDANSSYAIVAWQA